MKTTEVSEPAVAGEYWPRPWLTGCALPKGPGSLVGHDLPEAVGDARVGLLAGARLHLEACLDDIGRSQQSCRWHTWGNKIGNYVPLCNLL